MSKEKKTDDLLTILQDARTQGDLKRYIEDTAQYATDYVTYINELIRSRGIEKTDLIAATGIERTYLYQCLNGTRKPGRDYAVAICLAARCTLEETTRCLELLSAGILYAKNTRDAILIYAVNRSMSVNQTNELLFQMKEATLV